MWIAAASTEVAQHLGRPPSTSHRWPMPTSATSPGAALRTLAAAQDGVVDARGLRACGFTPGQVETLIRHDELHRLSLGTYLVDPYLYADVPLRARVRAAQLQHGPRSVACLDTAARLRGIQGLTSTARAPDAPVELALPPELARHQPRAGSVRLHFGQLDPPDVVTRGRTSAHDRPAHADRPPADARPRPRRLGARFCAAAAARTA